MPHQSYIERVYIEVVQDEDPDLSYLEQSYADVADSTERGRYLYADKLRLDAYRNSEWSMVGVRLVAELTYDREGHIDRPIEIRSAGIWGIESDSGRDYARETGLSQDDDLREQLEALRFTPAEIDHALDGQLEIVDSVGMTEPRPELQGLSEPAQTAAAGEAPSPTLS